MCDYNFITRHMSLYHSNGHMWWAGHNNPLLQRSGLSAAEPATLYYCSSSCQFRQFCFVQNCAICKYFSYVSTALKLRVEQKIILRVQYDTKTNCSFILSVFLPFEVYSVFINGNRPMFDKKLSLRLQIFSFKAFQ